MDVPFGLGLFFLSLGIVGVIMLHTGMSTLLQAEMFIKIVQKRTSHV